MKKPEGGYNTAFRLKGYVAVVLPPTKPGKGELQNTNTAKLILLRGHFGHLPLPTKRIVEFKATFTSRKNCSPSFGEVQFSTSGVGVGVRKTPHEPHT